MALRDRLAARITREGPISVADYMDACLNDPLEGYYATRPDLGAKGDFITAPLISQMFGEILGLWAAEVWSRLGRPARVRLVEMGPGQGVMMSDVLRVARAASGFAAAIDLWLVETSAPFRARQTETLANVASPRWVKALDETPDDSPIILLGNEMLDCLPIRQAIREDTGWRERRVGLDADSALSFVAGTAPTPPRPGHPLSMTAPRGAVAEWSPALNDLGHAVGAKIMRSRGAALFIDYGRGAPGLGDTLQAIRGHRKEDPLAHPGEADLTAHVDFPTFLAAAGAGGAVTCPIRHQGKFLCDMGLRARARRLATARPDRAEVIARQVDRLIGPDQMGCLFKCAALSSPELTLPGFETLS